MVQLRSQAAARQFTDLVEHVALSTGVLDALRSMGELSRLAARIPAAEAAVALRPLIANSASDPLAAYVALFALSGVMSKEADEMLVDALQAGDPGLAEHAAWALSRRRPVPSAVEPIVEMMGRGGFRRMMAELALESWLSEMPDLIWQAGADFPETVWQLSRAKSPSMTPRRRSAGMRIAQILMQGRVDAALSAPGSGDGGGLITLQVGLTRELANHDGVADAVLVTRSFEDGAGPYSEKRQEIVPGGAIARVEFGGSDYLSVSEMWAHRAELERELRDLLIGEGPFDAIHLRFADVGTFVGARLAEELGIPVYFTLAPDPHAVIAQAERDGTLTRANFSSADLEQHYVFRAWLVEWMLELADRLALLPRANQNEEFEALLGVDIDDGSGRFKVIAEGVDLELVEQARRAVREKSEPRPRVLGRLDGLVGSLPDDRRGLPLILSVGRLNRIKGMDRVAAAWAGDGSIRSSYNLLIVGGNLESPSREERASLEAITRSAGDAEGLILMGGCTHAEVAHLMSAAAEGVEDIVEPGGIYVSGSDKEEFGLAIVEAMAAGLPVVAPSTGGPATYVEHGFTGYLTETTEVDRIREGIRWAGRVRLSELRADAARRMVRSRYSLSTMASHLVEFYGQPRRRKSSA